LHRLASKPSLPVAANAKRDRCTGTVGMVILIGYDDMIMYIYKYIYIYIHIYTVYIYIHIHIHYICRKGTGTTKWMSVRDGCFEMS